MDGIRDAPKEDESRIVLSCSHFRLTGHDVTVKEMLDRTAAHLKTLLAAAERESTVKNPEIALLDQRYRVAGNKCDCCGRL